MWGGGGGSKFKIENSVPAHSRYKHYCNKSIIIENHAIKSLVILTGLRVG